MVDKNWHSRGNCHLQLQKITLRHTTPKCWYLSTKLFSATAKTHLNFLCHEIWNLIQCDSFVYKLTISSNLCNEVFLGDELLENVFIIQHFRDRFHQPLLMEGDTFSGTVNTTFHFHITDHPRKPHYIQFTINTTNLAFIWFI